jgi:hypothetical protein
VNEQEIQKGEGKKEIIHERIMRKKRTREGEKSEGEIGEEEI